MTITTTKGTTMTPDTPETIDYDRLVHKLRTAAAEAGLTRTNASIGGVNFMTSDVIGTYRTEDNRLVELSLGTGMMGQYLIGVTVRPDSTEQSCCVHSVRELALTLSEINGEHQ